MFSYNVSQTTLIGSHMQEGNAQDEEAPDDAPERVILLDTNCFLRLYHSPVRPFLGRVIGEYRLATIGTLVREFMNSPRLQDLYAWAANEFQQDIAVEGAVLELSDEVKAIVRENFESHEEYAQQLLDDHCRQKNITPRSFSREDIELLATAITLETLIATDEWPLTFLINDLATAPEGGYNIGAICTVDILRILEVNGAISAEQRIATVRSWMNYDEKLPRDWKAKYRLAFGEPPPYA